MTYDATRGYCMNEIQGKSTFRINYPYKSAFTFAVWLKYNASQTLGFNDWMSFCDSGGNYKMFGAIPANTSTTCAFGGAVSGGANITSCSVTSYTNTSWFMVAFSYDGTTATIYVNGTAYSASATGLNIGGSLLNTTGQIQLGALDNVGTAASSNGLFSSVYMWDQVLTPTQVNSVYTSAL